MQLPERFELTEVECSRVQISGCGSLVFWSWDPKAKQATPTDSISMAFAQGQWERLELVSP